MEPGTASSNKIETKILFKKLKCKVYSGVPYIYHTNDVWQIDGRALQQKGKERAPQKFHGAWLAVDRCSCPPQKTLTY